jgi:hypothetical protein
VGLPIPDGRDREPWRRYLSQKPDGRSAKPVFRLRSVCLTSHMPIPWIWAALHRPFVPGTLRAPTSSPLPRSAPLPDSFSAELPLVFVHLRGRRAVANDVLGRCAWRGSRPRDTCNVFVPDARLTPRGTSAAVSGVSRHALARTLRVPDIVREQCSTCGMCPLSREFAVRNDRAAMTLHVRSRSSVVRSGDVRLVMWRVRPSVLSSADRVPSRADRTDS